jgi:uncharacterized protein
MKFLLDVNVLLAAIWAGHDQNVKANAWLEDKEFVLCPISELGFLRISTNKRAIGAPMEKARELLRKFAAQAGRIPDDLDALDSHGRTSDQVTDHYLADLAAKHGLKLATFDGQLKHPSVELVR